MRVILYGFAPKRCHGTGGYCLIKPFYFFVTLCHMSFFLIAILLSLVLFSVGLCVHFWLRSKRLARYNRQLQNDYKALEGRLGKMELEGLQHKINPHLFKNILNSIQSHAYQTYFSLDKLSSVLDYILYETNKQFVSVKEELEFALNLIEINKLKLSPLFDISVKNRVNEAHALYEQELLAPMISADLIENAFRHADLGSSDSFISITFELKDDLFTITVANKISPGPALKKANSGLGKQSLERRLDLIYKGCYKLDQFEENGVFISHLKLNLLDYKAKMLAAG
jgi:sensor histidine kinase YesM